MTFAILDETGGLVQLASGETAQVLELLDGQRGACVAVNAPRRPNLGLVRSQLLKTVSSSSHLRGADLRVVEHELRGRGILVSPTPARVDLCPEWMQVGFTLFQHMQDLGFLGEPGGSSQGCCLETHPHLTFHVLLGQAPLPKPSLEGRLQRQLALFEKQLGIQDPMDFFEEITRHKLLKGELPLGYLYTPEELDALSAAYIALLAMQDVNQIALIGDSLEGRIAYPAEASQESSS